MTNQKPPKVENPFAKPPTPDFSGGATGEPWYMELRPWDYWKQTADPALDGDNGSGPNAANDCGPEAVAMVIAHLGDIVLDADYIMDATPGLGPKHRGYTSIKDLVQALHTLARTETITTDTVMKNTWLHRVWKALTLRHPQIGLFSFTAPNANDGHFRPIVGMGLNPNIVVTADPATGSKRTESWDVAWAWAKGPLIHVNRSRAIGK